MKYTMDSLLISIVCEEVEKGYGRNRNSVDPFTTMKELQDSSKLKTGAKNSSTINSEITENICRRLGLFGKEVPKEEDFEHQARYFGIYGVDVARICFYFYWLLHRKES